tara:strand:+ start:431 stop:721 length:291 start_codon:yes stop_codon:yes gene_type:complete
MSLDAQTVKKVANLSRIQMKDDAELTQRAAQLSKIVGFIEQLSEVNTDNIEPLANVGDITLHLRDDVVNDGDCVEKVLKNAPEETQGYFVVPKVVE